MHSSTVLPRSVYWLIAAISLFWGLNWPVMKIVLGEMPPLNFRAWCLGVAAIVLFALARVSGQRLSVPRKQWRALALIAFFNLAAWNVLAVFAIPMMDSGRAAILGYSMPLWAMILGFWWLKEPVTRRRLVGLALGFSGVLMLLGGEITAVGRAPLGAALMIAAAIGWAVGIVMIRRWPIDLPLLAFSAWQMAISFPLLLLGALIFEPGSPSPLELSTWPLAGLVYNILLPFIFCNWAWMRIATTAPVTVSSLSTLLVPVIGVFSGMLLLDERPGWNDYVALVLVCAALATVLFPARKSVS